MTGRRWTPVQWVLACVVAVAVITALVLVIAVVGSRGHVTQYP